MPAPVAPTNPLEYASGDTLAPRWGPILFRPSRLTLLLALLATLAATWLALRHDPWRRLASIPTSAPLVTFTRDGHLLAVAHDAGADLFDPTTGRLIRRTSLNLPVPSPLGIDPLRVIDDGDRLLYLPYGAPAATLIDLRSGHRQPLPLPVPDPGLVAVAPEARQALVLLQRNRRLAADLHQLRAGATTHPVQLSNDVRSIAFSPDGARILAVTPDPTDVWRLATLTLFDGRTGAPVGTPITGAPSGQPKEFFVAPGWLMIRRSPPETAASSRPLSTTLDFHSARDGARAHSLTLPTGGVSPWLLVDPRSVAVSDDGAVVAHVDWYLPAKAGQTTLDLYDAASGTLRARRPAYAGGGRPIFLPDSHRLFAGLPELNGAPAIIHPAHARPVALFPPPPGAPFDAPDFLKPHFGPDGRTIALQDFSSGRVTVYRKAGPDCPESPNGALAFPQTWLTSALFLAGVLSLARDARRGGTQVITTPAYSPVIAGGLVAVGAPLTLVVLLAACLGRLTHSPAPLLLLAGIGLAVGSRFWRLATLVVLCGTLAWCAYLVAALVRAGSLRDTIPWTPLDRAYEVPRAIPVTALAVAAVLAVLAIVLLVLRRRRAA